jgi:nucleoside phosphorylase/tetratricopeptide (TPR) repeat protein
VGERDARVVRGVLCDVLVLTALPLEREAMLEVDTDAISGSSWETHVDSRGLPVSFRSFAARAGRSLRVAVTMSPNMGATAAIETLTRLVEELTPACIAMCGVCAGRRGKIELGDVVAAERLFYYDTGKRLPHDTLQDLTTYPLRVDWKVALENMDAAARFRDAAWLDARPIAVDRAVAPPLRLQVAPLASGTQVVEDEAIWEVIARSVRTTLALDMEAAAVAELAHRCRIDAVVMKGVMDFADHGRDDRHKAFAARASAECLLAFLRDQLPTDLSARFDDLLTSGSLSAPSHARPSSLLLARHEVVPWHEGGRSNVLAELDAWADDPERAVTVQLVHAAGGAGKTRLAIEWVRRRRERGDAAGFLVANPDPRWLDRLSGLGPPIVVVIDYAERRADLVAVLETVATFALASRARRRVRILLLARSDGDWWDVLRLRGSLEIGALLDHVRPIMLSPLAGTTSDREAVYREAAAEFAKLRRRRAPSGPPVALVGAGFDRVLYLHMAALAAVEGVALTAAGGVASLMDVILDHEERFWTNEASALHTVAVQLPLGRQLMAAATLRGALGTEHDARELCARITGQPCTPDDRAMIALLHHVYSRADDALYLPGLEPDLLGEAMVLRAARPPRGAGSAAAPNWIDCVFARGDDDISLTTAFVVLGRASVIAADEVRPWIAKLLQADFSTRAVLALRAAKIVGQRSALSVLGDLLADELERRNSAVIAFELDREQIPFPTVSLQRVAAWTTQQLRHTIPTGDDAAAMSERAALLAREGLEHDAAGHHARALAATQDAVKLYRMLLTGNRDEYQPLLARTLNTLGICWSALGAHHAARSTLREAVELCRKLVERQPRTYEPDLARSLSNLGVMRNVLGEHDEALADLLEAVDLHSALADRNPDVFRPELAMSLNNLGNEWAELGNHDDAFRATHESVMLYQRLAQRHPDAFQPDYARALNNLGNRLGALGRHDKALEVATRSVGLYRKLSERNSDAFQAALANSLNNLGVRWRELQQPSHALTATLEAVERYRKLTEQHAGAFHAALATSLTNLGKLWGNLGRTESALEATREVVHLYRRITGTAETSRAAGGRGKLADLISDRKHTTGLRKFDGFQRRLAESLAHLASRLSDVGHPDAAIVAMQDAAEVYRFLAKWNADVFEPELARSLNHLSNLCSGEGQIDAALEATRDAEALCRRLVVRRPGAFEADLANTLSNLSNRLHSAGDSSAALDATYEAVALYRQLDLRDANAFRAELAHSLNVLGIRWSELGQHDAALAVTRESVALYRELIGAHPGEFEATLAAALSNLASVLHAVGQRGAAVEASREATCLRRPFVDHRRDPRPQMVPP